MQHLSFRKTGLSTLDIEFSGVDMEDEQLECTLALDFLPSVSNHEEMLEVTIPVCEVSKSIEESINEKKKRISVETTS